jgi:hypothetical protein
LVTATFFGAVLRANGFGAAFFAGLAFAAAFLAGRTLTPALRVDALAAVARLAFGLDDACALATRFAVFALDFAFDRDADRLRPFVRLLLMGGISKGCSREREQPLGMAELTIEGGLNQ